MQDITVILLLGTDCCLFLLRASNSRGWQWHWKLMTSLISVSPLRCRSPASPSVFALYAHRDYEEVGHVRE